MNKLIEGKNVLPYFYFVIVCVVVLLCYISIPSSAAGEDRPVVGSGDDRWDIDREIIEITDIAAEFESKGLDLSKVFQLLEKAKSFYDSGKMDEARELLNKAREILKNIKGKPDDGRNREERELQRRAAGLLEAASILADVGEYGTAAELADRASRMLRDLEHRRMIENLPPEERDKVIIKDRLELIARLLEELKLAKVDVRDFRERLAAIQDALSSAGMEKTLPDLDSLQMDIEKAMEKLRQLKEEAER